MNFGVWRLQTKKKARCINKPNTENMKNRLLLLILAGFLTLMANAQYTLSPNDVVFDTLTGSITAYTLDSTDIVIPDSLMVNGTQWAVLKIGSNAFMGKSLKNVRFPSVLQSIGNDAFSFNQIDTLRIPDGVTEIRSSAFRLCGIVSVKLPSKLSYLGGSSFRLNQISSIEFPDSLKHIRYHTFYGNKISNLVIPEGVEQIDNFAFFGNKISNLTIARSVNKIEGGAFNSNRIDSLNGIPSDGIIYARKADGSDDSTTIVSYGGPSKNINFIPAHVKVIGYSAFEKDSLTSVNIPGTVDLIQSSAFSDNELTSLVLPNSIKTLEPHVFSSNKLTSVVFGNQLEVISEGAFSSNELSDVRLPNSVEYIGSSAFVFNNLTNLTLSSSLTEIGEMAFWNNSLTNVSIPNKVQLIGEYAFADNSLTSIALPTDVQKEGHKFIEWKDSDSNVVTSISDFSKAYIGQFAINGFVVSGIVNSHGHQDISIRVTGEIQRNVEVDFFDGSFSFAVDSGRNIFVSPTHPTRNFKPYGVSLINIQSDTSLSFYAQYELSGSIFGANDVTVSLLGDSTDSQNVSSDSGSFSFEVNYMQQVIIRPTKPGKSFSPSEYNLGTISSDRDDLDFIAGPISSLKEKAPTEVRIYPNPVNAKLTVEGEELQRVEVLTLNGVLIASKEFLDTSSVNIDLTDKDQGILLLKLTDKNGLVSYERLVKN